MTGNLAQPARTEPIPTNLVRNRRNEHSNIAVVEDLRGVASFAVAWFHFTHGNPSFLRDGLLKSTGTYGWLGVDMFFVISGFILPYALLRGEYQLSTANFCRFVWKRISRLDPPYIASIVVVISLGFLAAKMPGFLGSPPSFSWPNIFLHLGYLPGFVGVPWLNPVYWTLAIEFQYYLLLAFVYPVLVHPNRWVRIVLTLLLLTPCVFRLMHGSVFEFMGIFIMGIVVFQRRVGRIDRTECIACFAVASVACLYALSAAATVAGLATAAAILGVKGTNRILTFLGKISYSLYLVHCPIGGKVVNLGQHLHGGWGINLMVLATASALSLAAAYIMYRFIELPCKHYATRIRFTGTA